MPLTPQSLASLVFIDHLAAFPQAAAVSRRNTQTGVPPHIPAQAFIEALTSATVTALKTLTIFDLGGGTLDVPGNAPPVPIVFPAIPAAQAYLITRQGWVGPSGALASSIFVGSVLTNVMKITLLKMNPNPLMGTGAGVISPASNPALEAQALAALMAAITPAFQATGKFGTNDIPGSPVNPTLLPQLPGYAEALAKGIASMTAATAYVGTASNPSPIAGALGSGILI